MPCDEQLEKRILVTIDGWKNVSVKKVFGGVCHLIRGNMFCGAHKDVLILRLGEAAAADALSKPQTKLFDITGRPMKGWVMVEPAGCETDDALGPWLHKRELLLSAFLQRHPKILFPAMGINGDKITKPRIPAISACC